MSKDKKKKKDNDKNIIAEVDGSTLTLTVDLDTELGESQTGRSMIIANSGNFMSVEDAEGYGFKLIVTRRKAKEKD